MKKASGFVYIIAALLLGPYTAHAENGTEPTQQSALGVCYGESKSAWLVGLGIEGKETAEQTDKFIASLPHSSDSKTKIADGATAMRQGRFTAAEDLGAAQYASCAKTHSLQVVDPNKIADCFYYLRIMNSFHASKKRGDSEDQALDSMIKVSPGATEVTKRLLAFLATRTYETKDINLEHRMTFDWCAGKR